MPDELLSIHGPAMDILDAAKREELSLVLWRLAREMQNKGFDLETVIVNISFTRDAAEVN